MQVHVARVGFVNVNSMGVVVDKNDPNISISAQLNTSSDHRLIVDQSIPNTLSRPTVKDYLIAEARDNYVLQYMDQNTIVTYLRNATGGFPG